MSKIIIRHIIEKNRIVVSFDLQDGSLSFPSIDLDIAADIDLKPLLLKLSELIEINKSLEIIFDDSSGLRVEKSKIELVINTLDEIYVKFNEIISNDEENDSDVTTPNDDLELDF